MNNVLSKVDLNQDYLKAGKSKGDNGAYKMICDSV